MSAIGNLFWRVFDGQAAAGSTHQDSIALNQQEARANVKAAGAYLSSPFTTIRDAYRAEPTKATGWKRIGLGLMTGLAFLPLAVRGLIGGAFYGLLALKNGAIDAAAHGVATMFDRSHTGPSPQPAPAPSPSPAPAPSPALKPGRVSDAPGGGPGSTGGVGRVRVRVAQAN